MSEAEVAGHAPVFDERLGAWIVEDAGDCRALLAHEGLGPPPYGDLYGDLERRFGLDFGNLRFAFDHIPLCLHGARHAAARKAIAAELGARRGAVARAMPELVARHFAVLGRPGRAELMAEAVDPFVAALMGALVGLEDATLDRETLVSRIFSRGMGIAKRKRAEREVGALRQRIAEVAPGDDATGRRLAMMILGRDALTGTLARSLEAVLRETEGRPLREAAIPPLPPRTGVSYIERMAYEPVRHGALDLQPGTRVRLMLATFEQGTPPESERFFGTGAHTCLGRPVSLEAWQGLRAFLGGLPTRVAVVDAAPREDDIFAVPTRLVVEVAS